MKKLNLLLLSTMLIMTGCTTNHKTINSEVQNHSVSKKNVELTISAAASLQDALLKIKTDFEKKYPNLKVNYNFGASGSLGQQISLGAPVDLFFSAAEDKFNILVRKGLIDKDQETDLVGNDIVLVVPKNVQNGINSFKDLYKAKKISIGTPETVPAGKYAEETLKKINLWNSVDQKIVYAKDVRQVLTYVETGNVDAGIIYKTDAMHSSKVKIISTANPNTHEPIIYPVGVIKNSSHSKEAKIFYNFLQNKDSLKTLENYGFKDIK
jgi:molybdate transport system substrate-binding protein